MDSARAVVSRLLAVLSPGDSVYPEALYTAGILSPDPQAVARNLQRVAVEFGLSSWADDALLRLTQFHFAQGDPAATVGAAERLRRDYPDSPLRPRAAFPAARAYFDLRDETHGCALIREALAGAGEDVEFKNQVSFYAARCAAVPFSPGAAPADSATRPDSAASPSPEPVVAFTVQVLAVKSAAQVDELLTRLKVMGFDARVIRDTSGLFKVRVGRYTTREEAQRVQARLKTRLGGQPFLVEEP
jgi:cell division septation protein DedD